MMYCTVKKLLYGLICGILYFDTISLLQSFTNEEAMSIIWKHLDTVPLTDQDYCGGFLTKSDHIHDYHLTFTIILYIFSMSNLGQKSH